jgi:hypothetical protein
MSSFLELKLLNITPGNLLSSIKFRQFVKARFNEFNATKAYTVLSLFNLLQLPLRMIGMVMMMLAASRASLKRVDHFQKSEEKSFNEVDLDENLAKGQIIIQDGEFSWDTEKARRL